MRCARSQLFSSFGLGFLVAAANWIGARVRTCTTDPFSSDAKYNDSTVGQNSDCTESTYKSTREWTCASFWMDQLPHMPRSFTLPWQDRITLLIRRIKVSGEIVKSAKGEMFVLSYSILFEAGNSLCKPIFRDRKRIKKEIYGSKQIDTNSNEDFYGSSQQTRHIISRSNSKKDLIPIHCRQLVNYLSNSPICN